MVTSRSAVKLEWRWRGRWRDETTWKARKEADAYLDVRRSNKCGSVQFYSIETRVVYKIYCGGADGMGVVVAVCRQKFMND